MEGLAEVTLQYKDAFADRKREQNILDFTDMEHFALDILMHKEGDTIYTECSCMGIICTL